MALTESRKIKCECINWNIPIEDLAMIKHQNKIIAHATTAQQAKELKALTATLKEQASQIQKVSDRLEHLKPTKKDLMISKIISGAACLAELTSNPKSFYNCPDLHGGVPGLAPEIKSV
jgi:uncharacterized coiled-coil protein SlyX